MAEKFDQAAYTAAYNKENYSRIEMKVSKELKARWELQAKAAGQSLTAWLTERASDLVEGWSYILIKAFQKALNHDYYGDGPMPVNGRLTELTRAGLTISNFLSRFK